MRSHFSTRLTIGLIALLLAATSTSGQTTNWPRFRGPNGTGVANDPALSADDMRSRLALFRSNVLAGIAALPAAASR